MTTPLLEQLTPPGGWQTPGRVRLAPLTPETSTRAQRVLMRVINKVGKLEASNLFLMLMRNFRLFWNWLMFAKQLMPYGQVPRVDTELVILRVGWNCRSRYEWGQHVDIGLRAGVSAEDIARIPLGADAPGWEPHLKALMQACDEFHHERMIGEASWAVLEAHYGPRLLLEVVMLIGHYEMLAGVLNSTGLPLDTRLEGVLAAAPIHGRRA
ncbi:MAG: carboxymuconolactone decarboxylase family protein [Pseudomonadota bacterium]